MLVPGQSRAHAFTLRTAAGQAVGLAEIGRSDGQNVPLAFTAHGLPVNRTHMFTLWAGIGNTSMEVGQFMVDVRGGCRVHFSIPATHNWARFWVAQPGNATEIVAST